MGATGSGKTSVSSIYLVVIRNLPGCLQFINLASGSALSVGKDLESCTAEVTFANLFTLDGHRVMLIDTPEFDDPTKSDMDILKLIAAFLATS